jgi:hypothetical protein
MPCYRTPFQSIIQWPHLDFNALGVTKQMIGLDLVADAPEGVYVSIGYDQTDRDARTDDYLIDADTLPAQLVPFPVSAPSFDLKLTFVEDQAWQWDAAVIYVQNFRLGT